MIYSVAQFSQDTGITQTLAERLLDLLYKKELSAEDLNSLIWRMRDWVMQTKLPEILEGLKDPDLNALIDQMVAERKMWRAPYDVCCAETPEAFSAALKRLTHPSSMRFVSELAFSEKKLKAGDTVVIQIMRTGTWQHSLYGEVKVTREMLKEVKKNFDDNVRGVQIAVDENHEDNHAALAWHEELFFEEGNEDALFARATLTQAGADKSNDGAYKYYSPEIAFQWTNEETGTTYSNLLIGGAFTNRPFFKGMKALQASESASANGQGTPETGLSLFLFSSPDRMKNFLALIAKFSALPKLTKEQKAELDAAFKEVPEPQRSAEITGFYNDLAGRFSEEGGDAPAVDPPAVETPAADVPAPVAAEGGEQKGDEQDGKAPNGDTPAASTIQANENGLLDGMEFNDEGLAVVVDSAKVLQAVKGMQAKLSETSRAARFAEVTGKVKAMSLSKANPKGIVTPLVFKDVVDFTMKLNEKQGAEFLKIVGKFRSVGGEMGKSVDAVMDPMDPSYAFTENDEKVKFFMEKLAQPLDKAIESAKNFYAAERAKNKK